ncbi:hypothetical protein FS837_012842 [Tulasnella sp. UAMH 9824]|nr:hypothetical protein FS837_012842 [Tulasnella sp. UAMH 9824]
MEAQEIFARIGKADKEVNVLCELRDLYYDPSNNIDPEGFHAEARKISARKLFDEVQANGADQAKALYRMGEVYCGQSLHNLATPFYAQAYEIYSHIGDENGQANALYRLGQLYRRQSEYDQATSYYTEAQEIFARIGKADEEVNALGELRDLYRDRSNTIDAEVFHTEAQKISARNIFDEGQATSLYRLGEVYRGRSHYEQAASSYSEALEIYTRNGNDKSRADALYALGAVYCRQMKGDQAESYYNEAQQLYARVGHGAGQAKALFRLGEVYHRQSRYDRAISSYSEAKEICIRLGNHFGEMQASRALSSLRSCQDFKDLSMNEKFTLDATTAFTSTCAGNVRGIKSAAPPRLQALYFNVYWQKQSNPAEFQWSSGYWSNPLETVVRKGKQPPPQSSDHLKLHTSDKLVEAFMQDKVRRPIGLGAVLEQAARATISQRRTKPPGFTESLYKRQSLRAEVESFALKDTTLSLLDVGVALKYLKRDARVVVVQKNVWVCLEPFVTYFSLLSPVIQAVKFVEPADAEAIAGDITEMDLVGSLEVMKTTLQKLADQISEIEGQIREPLHLLERSEQFSRIRCCGKTLSDRPWNGWPTCSRTTRKFKDAISLVSYLAASYADVSEVDGNELKDESEMLIEERKEEEEAEKERVRLEEKRKAEEKKRVRVEAKKRRKAKEEAETLKQEEEEVRRKLKEVGVSPETDPGEDWEKLYDEAQGEKAAQVTRDLEVE